MATPYLLFLLVIQCIIRGSIRTWRVWWKPLITINSNGKGTTRKFIKYCWFICEWDSRARSLHYSTKDWPARKSLEPGIKNVENQPLVESSKILFSYMHLMLGLMKNFVKAMNQEVAAFTYLWEKFPRLSEAKLKEDIFTGPQIREIIKDEYFDKPLQGDEKAAWASFKFVVKVFLGNRRAQNCEELVNKLLQSYQKLGCNMKLKIHFLHSHLDFSWRIVVQWVMNTENISIKTFLQWRRDIKGNGNVLCSPTTSGLWQGMPLPWNTSDRGRGGELFVLNNELTWKRLCRCSIYVVNIIFKLSKFTKHILFQWIVFSFLFKPPFRTKSRLIS